METAILRSDDIRNAVVNSSYRGETRSQENALTGVVYFRYDYNNRHHE